MRKKRRALLKQVFTNAGLDKIIGAFLVFFLISALLIWIFEPTIHSFFDSLWYCFVAVATIGFGDLTATVLITRIITIILWVYSIVVIAIFTAVITGYYMDLAKLKADESIQHFLSELERLPELSKEELKELSERVKKMNKNK